MAANLLKAGTGFITSLTENAGVGELISFEISIQGVGQILSGADMRNITFDRTDITFDDTDVTFDEI